MTLQDLIDRSRREATASSAWLGADGQRALLQSYVDSRVSGTPIVWGPRGGGSYLQAGRITLERLPASDVPDASDTAADQALVVFHETLNRLHSDQANVVAFRQALDRVRARNQVWIAQLMEDLFNSLEDVRMAHADQQRGNGADDALIDDFHAQVIARKADDYRRHIGEDPSTLNPKHKAAQVRFALLERIYLGEVRSLLHSDVSDVMAACEPAIEGAVTAPSTAAARSAAIELGDIVRGRLLDLSK